MNLKMERTLKFAVLAVGMMSASVNSAHADTCVVDDSFWLQPRSGAAVLNEQSIKPCIQTLLTDNTSKLWITYNDTDDSSISATELRQWLVALALPAERIILKKASTLTDPIRLEIQHD